MLNLALLADYESNNIAQMSDKIAQLCVNQAEVNLLLAGNRASDQLVEAAHMLKADYGKFTVTWFTTQTKMLEKAGAVLAFTNGENKYTRYGLHDAKKLGVTAQRSAPYTVDAQATQAFKASKTAQIVAKKRADHALKLRRLDAMYAFSIDPVLALSGDECADTELIEALLLAGVHEAKKLTFQLVNLPATGLAFRLPVGETVGEKIINVWRVVGGAVQATPVKTPVVRVKRPARAAGRWSLSAGLEYEDYGICSTWPNGDEKPSLVVQRETEKELGIATLPVPTGYRGLQRVTRQRVTAQGATTETITVHRGRVVARSVVDHMQSDFADLAEDPRGFAQLEHIDDSGHIAHDKRASSAFQWLLPSLREAWQTQALALGAAVDGSLYAEGLDPETAAVIAAMNYDQTDARPRVAYDYDNAILRTIARLHARYSNWCATDSRLPVPTFRKWLRCLLRDETNLHPETQEHIVEFLTRKIA